MNRIAAEAYLDNYINKENNIENSEWKVIDIRINKDLYVRVKKIINLLKLFHVNEWLKEKRSRMYNELHQAYFDIYMNKRTNITFGRVERAEKDILRLLKKKNMRKRVLTLLGLSLTYSSFFTNETLC